MLMAGSALCFMGYGLQEDKTDQSNLYLAIVLAICVVITGLMAFYMSSKAANIMAQFKDFIPPLATVWRDGAKR